MNADTFNALCVPVSLPWKQALTVMDDTAQGVLLAVDRQERGQGERSAVQEVEAEFGLRCVSLLTLTDLIDILADPNASRPALPAEQLAALREYRARYGIHAASPQ